MTLPTLFLERMESLLGKKQFPLFLKTYQETPPASIRVVKGPQSFLTALSIEKIPWVENGHYISNQAIQSVHPYHLAGGFYIQEASAMGVVPMMDIQPHDMVLDWRAVPPHDGPQLLP
jgi:16S rRNA C967 or C1407 C5-methylase (RsmB/RsmF family)